ncbi:MAG: hypothetical protein K9J37_11530 [Saprospiraceae bacterium]|nr:hypothetical protein [Saprospiraceae bacterium]MCF8250537.1 hypothetical protein [Saprospiraceae bacterium]MCF8279677.1 hypothetical protein [Bacteroidales bacterium]MCF8312463.1 hypothetical protein [Saprospiraceae bacterium]MCF8440720.1 hypothetical protein [Saprospiraceae bacterium]
MIHNEAIGLHIRVADILEQIEGLDKMIAFHEKHSPDDAMLKQYQYLRQKHYLELVKMMRKYNFHLSEIKSNKRNVPMKKAAGKVPLSTAR